MWSTHFCNFEAEQTEPSETEKNSQEKQIDIENIGARTHCSSILFGSHANLLANIKCKIAKRRVCVCAMNLFRHRNLSYLCRRSLILNKSGMPAEWHTTKPNKPDERKPTSECQKQNRRRAASTVFIQSQQEYNFIRSNYDLSYSICFNDPRVLADYMRAQATRIDIQVVKILSILRQTSRTSHLSFDWLSCWLHTLDSCIKKLSTFDRALSQPSNATPARASVSARHGRNRAPTRRKNNLSK